MHGAILIDEFSEFLHFVNQLFIAFSLLGATFSTAYNSLPFDSLNLIIKLLFSFAMLYGETRMTYLAPDKRGIQIYILSYFSIKTNVVGTY